MNNRIIVTMLSLIISLMMNTTFAQGKYASFNCGYGFSSSSQNITGFTNSTSIYNSSTSSSSDEQINFSLGKGLSIGGNFGYMYDQNIGAEIGISYLLGGKTSNKRNDVSNSTIDVSNSDIYSNMVRINPSIVLTTNPSMSGISPYAKFGFIIGSGSIYVDRVGTSGTDVENQSYEFYGGYALGMTANIGATYRLNDKTALFGELALVSMSYAPTNGEVTSYTVNGVDKLGTLTTNKKKIEFKDTTTSTGQSAPASLPAQELSQKFPLGSLGLNIGVKYDL